MKKVISILIAVFFSLSILSQENYLINEGQDKTSVSLSEFIIKLENSFSVRFFYKPELIINKDITIKSFDLPLDTLLKATFGVGTSLNYYLDRHGNIFLFPDTSDIVKTLPDYTYENTQIDTGELTHEKTQIEGKYLESREPDMIETIEVGNANVYGGNKNAIITGKLIDATSGELLVGATLYIHEIQKGAVSNAKGSLSISVKPGKYTASFQCLGMSTIKCFLVVKSDGYFSISMKPKLTSIDEVTVTASDLYSRGSKPGLENISLLSIKELPALMGEKDVMKIARMLPGIVGVSEASGGVNVRGGNVDQNLFYLNEMPIYNPSHLFGFFSSVNSDLISRFTIFKGHVPAHYGGRLSSVFNVETRKGNKNKFFAQGGVGPVSAHFTTEIPVVKKKASLIFSSRSSYSDWILNQLKDPVLRNSSAGFSDFAINFDCQMNENNQLSIFTYLSNDNFNLNKETTYNYKNKGFAINYMHRFSPRFRAEVSAIKSNYDFSTKDRKSVSAAYAHAYSLSHNELKYQAYYMLNDRHKFSAGVNTILYQLNRGIVEPYGKDSKRNELDLGEETGIESAFFIDDSYTPVNWLNIYFGLRYSMFHELGPKTVLNYHEKNSITNIDTVLFQKSSLIKSYNGPEIRFAIDFKINLQNSIKLSYTQMRQYLFMLSNTLIISPTDQWKLVDSHISPPVSKQYSVSYFHKFKKGSYSTSLEGYYKKADNVVEYKEGADFLSTPYIETSVLQGSQTAYGVEFMVKKEKGNLNGWVSYSWSRSFMQIDGDTKAKKINNGQLYPSNYDKPHVLNLYSNYRINRRFSISSNIAYSSGRPITIPQNIFYVHDNPYVDYSDRNAYRLPDYFRMDLSIAVEGNLKKKKFMHNSWLFSVYNLTGRKNPHSVYFLSENGKVKGYQYSVIGTAIFTATWNFKFGNYASN